MFRPFWGTLPLLFTTIWGNSLRRERSTWSCKNSGGASWPRTYQGKTHTVEEISRNPNTDWKTNKWWIIHTFLVWFLLDNVWKILIQMDYPIHTFFFQKKGTFLLYSWWIFQLHPWKLTAGSPENHPFEKENHKFQTKPFSGFHISFSDKEMHIGGTVGGPMVMWGITLLLTKKYV